MEVGGQESVFLSKLRRKGLPGLLLFYPHRLSCFIALTLQQGILTWRDESSGNSVWGGETGEVSGPG